MIASGRNTNRVPRLIYLQSKEVAEEDDVFTFRSFATFVNQLARKKILSWKAKTLESRAAEIEKRVNK
jgi:hypothetical protein